MIHEPSRTIGSLTAATMAELRSGLVKAHYTVDEVLDRIGSAGQAALTRNTTIAVEDALDDDAQSILIRLWVLQQAVPIARLETVLGDSLAQLVAANLIETDGARARACVEIRPFGLQGQATDFSGWICADLTQGLDGSVSETPPDYVLGLSPASTMLTRMTIRRPVGSALDLGTGCGVQSVQLARHAARVVATDINPRALRLAAVTAGLNDLELDLRSGSLFEPVAGERFDLIVTNPPYVMSPPEMCKLLYREQPMRADDLVREVVVGGSQHLNPGGTLQILGNWAITAGQPWQERLAAWVGQTDCDALILERERLDPYEYIEIWLNDAGLGGSSAYRQTYRTWLEYFHSLGIVGVGLGWLNLTKAGRSRPHVQIESWPHEVVQPIGVALAAHQDGVNAADVSDAELLAAAWLLDPDVVQETTGQPGAPDPAHIVLRQRTGLLRAVEVDTGLAAVLGACDGEIAMYPLILAAASLLDVDAAALSAEILPRLRRLIVDRFLLPA